MSHLSFEQKTRVISCLVEGNSVRSTERLCDIHRDTILRHMVAIGEGCQRLHDVLFVALQCNLLELDEVWSFLGKKQKRVKPEDPAAFGDQYVFTALDATRKAIVSYTIGKRDGDTAYAFTMDLRSRVLNKPQISTDGFKPYLDAIARAFGRDVPYAMIYKEYGHDEADDARRYSPPKCIASEKRVISGQPDLDKVSTSYVERSNLTLRMGCRRFTRLTNGYSKKLRNHAAATGLHVAYYNLCRVHHTLRVTPAMALGLTDHVWSVDELIEEALTLLPVEPEPVVWPVLPEHVQAADDRQLWLFDDEWLR